MKALELLQGEHAAALEVLDQLDLAAAAVAAKVPVPAAIFSDIQEFFEVFIERCHHTKEEAAVFPALDAGGEAPLIQRLRADHVSGHLLAARYTMAVHAYQQGDMVAGRKLAEAARAYSEFLRQHIALETAELFPAVERVLQDADDELVEAFERIERDEIGEGVHERLHGMIAQLPLRLSTSVAAAS